MLASCNQVFDLNETVHVDVARRDAVPDAAVTCPPTGTAPRFSTQLTQAIAQTCNEYVFSSTTQMALATCYSDQKAGVFEGQLDKEMVPAKGFAPPVNFQIERVRLAPDGDFAFTRLASFTLGTYRIGTYQRDRRSVVVRRRHETCRHFDRASLADRWNAAVALEGVPNNIADAVLSEDCSRLYFSALSSVFYLSRAP